MPRFRWWSVVAVSLLVEPSFPLSEVSADTPEEAKPAVRAPTPSPARSPAVQSRDPSRIEGTYRVDGGSETIEVRRLMGDFYHLRSESWEGVGILTGSEYRGMFRDSRKRIGQHLIDWRVAGEPDVRIAWLDGSDAVRQRWKGLAQNEGVKEQPPKNIVVAPPDSNERPALGEYVYVEELPEAVTKVPPNYPEAARRAGIDGTVMVQALVQKDGTVGDTKIVSSIPALDEAAVASVRQWRFKPATAKGLPVAVWVAVPIKFSLH